MNPVIALVGRPNVGKSTLFNRLTRTRDALVADLAGLTRDRKFGAGKVGERDYIVVDTGGISGMEQGLDAKMAEQSFQAMDEADIVLFLVDARAGLTSADKMIAQHLRATEKKTYVVVNKIDGLNPDVATSEFYELGLGELQTIAATHNRGINVLMDHVLNELPPEFQIDEDADEEDESEKGVRISVVGRPNVGKSTLVNRMLGEDRVVVYDHPGTTMDSIEIPYERNEKPYTLIDTAGVRRRKNIKEAAEKFSIVKALQAIQDANVCIVVIDAREGIVEQDLTMLSFVLNSGKGLVIALNKWDGMDIEQKDFVKKELERRLSFVDWADMHFISAKHGTGVGHLYESVDEAYKSAYMNLSTSQLTRILEDAVMDHQPPLVGGRRIKLRYAHQGGMNPPVIVVHGNKTASLPDSYKRYLANTFRKVLNISGTPIRFEFRSGENPYADQKEDKLFNRSKRKETAEQTASIRQAKKDKLRKKSKKR
ncbi:ribosome biogenesis GTPase Der [Bermanella marisrubri]|uniref:GTPase Der n=1 Tax=Bermanella marisrubri TaxID=207949 RepID=Q1N0I2_9GAMM|nr:ribosome biogenesis GTPase Der [Bermanella marisrubri]EAT11682.1 predicted GTPase [Oceanobacter sp. RED65] [Bermanella marisrubri]QIZ83282.1 ribosome biogenesis GTPase Der [Bermanella marisrubri]